jgi:hypothetical protein
MHRLLLAGAALAGCAETPTLTENAQSLYCDEFLCTGNSAIVHGKKFGELDEFHAVSPAGFGIVQTYAPNGDAVELEVEGPWARIVWPGGASLSDAKMVNTQIVLSTPFDPPNDELTLLIKEYRQIPYLDGLPGPRIAAFKIEYTHFDEDIETWVPAKLCPYETVNADGVAGTWAIFSQGDRFSDEDTTIIATGPAVLGWFNVSCAGSVITKLLKMRHAFAAEDGTHSTKPSQREAALRMFTAKYCEKGQLYTTTNQPLTWEDYPGWSIPVPSHPEAVWTENGAYCLVKPRYADPKEIECDIPQCSKAVLENWRSRGWLMSYIPY